MADFTIRPARLPEDELHLVGFIAGLNDFEAEFEPDRAPGAGVAAAFFADRMRRANEGQGLALVAERDGRPVGWALGYVNVQAIYVKPELRRYGYIAELYVEADARGIGIGSTLIAGLEDHFRKLGLPYVMIGVLEGNGAARSAYERAGYRNYALDLRKFL